MNGNIVPHYATLERLVETDREDGTQTHEWVTDEQVWITIEPSRGREYVEAQTGRAEVTHRVGMWYRPNVTSKGFRFVVEERVFEIVSVINLGEGNRKLRLLCKETT
ncbi:MAG: phage head closure protein [Burkholderiales bacterium]|nr:phage head closure protein [Burkholderiales bacterium]